MAAPGKALSKLRATPEEFSVTEEVAFFGHAAVRATHRTTIEVTRDEHLTPNGDCIVGVRASKGVADLGGEMKRALRSDATRVRLTLVAPGGTHCFWARGSEALSFESGTEMVIRKSGFVCGRTLAVHSDCSAIELPRSLVASLKSPTAAGLLRIEAFA